MLFSDDGILQQFSNEAGSTFSCSISEHEYRSGGEKRIPIKQIQLLDVGWTGDFFKSIETSTVLFCFPSMVCPLNSQVKSSFIAKPRLSVSNMSTENCTSCTWLCRSGLLGRASSKGTGGLKHPDFYPGSVRASATQTHPTFTQIKKIIQHPLQRPFKTAIGTKHKS